MPIVSLTQRDRAILADVGAGRVEMTCSCAPTLFVDGRCCCDQRAANTLAHSGLIAPQCSGAVGTRVPAVLTPAGVAALAVTR